MKKTVKIGNLTFGDGRVYIQSMLSIPADDIPANIAQAQRLERAGCEVIRAAVPTVGDVRLISALKESVKVPIVADIHFDYRIALEAVAAGADKIRINPGNIGDEDRVAAVARTCRNAGVAIRVGVNAGSAKGGKSELAREAMANVRLLERFDFTDIVVAVKCSGVRETVAAYRELAGMCDYPLHLGVTEAGTERMGLVKSAIAIGGLLCDGIGDTLRVSLTADPEREVAAALDILRAVGLRGGVEIVSCPTCGRCGVDVIALTAQLERALAENPALERRLSERGTKIAVMGCAVNGPGECRDADYGITGGNGEGLIFRKGEIVEKVKETGLISALLKDLEKL